MSRSAHLPAAKPTAEQIELRRAGLRARAEQALADADDDHARLSAVETLRCLDRREAEGGAS